MASGGIRNFANLSFSLQCFSHFGFLFILALFLLNSVFPNFLHCREMDAIYEGFISTFLHVFYLKMALRTCASLKTVYSESKCNYPGKVSVWVCSPAISEFYRLVLF